MRSIVEVAREALTQMPPETRLRAEDQAVIERYRDTLLSWTSEVVKAFYDTLLSHPPTRDIFREGERPEREKTLEGWWKRTIEGPLDEAYFAWMAKVGLVHVVRGVENPMMLAMAAFIAEFVEKKSHEEQLPHAHQLSEAFYRLSMSVAAVITHGYVYYQSLALHNVIGMEPALVKRLTAEEAKQLLATLG